ncbi:16S rRNA (cytosine(967)-C(5))-methyltransferase RsmB [Trinickia symbiotica]|uniref:16S rRNA (Cytosine(967)-C(5))-methyltransferase RsmB n=1 Tax=Trinickia symbiotica TaxID=863227 RepID=A0A2T3XYD8_9BURK|nr:16S rRNA (cytosine(967)-C(5))-methyltransferase RsmB [Trinickia symbiotica]PTB21528.1 16S rRNA (cytosine(967)-C(5))-methyltransferase RsmB [Trinickia symbiotica]
MTRSSSPRRHAAKPATARGSYLSALHLAPDSLGFALDAAAQAVGAVRGGTALPAALAAVHAQSSAAAVALSRGAVQDIAYRTLRRLGTADWLIARLVRKPPPTHVASLLACALALLADEEDGAMTGAEGRSAYAAYTVVDQAVSAIGARRELAFAKGLVNAVLRNFVRERASLLGEAATDAVARWNYPRWWIDAVARAWPERWQQILDIGNRPGPLTLRVNARRATVAAYEQTLREAGIEALGIGTHALRLAAPMPVERIPGFAEGVVSVQDAGAQLAAEWLGARDGMRVLDACAAPGGKTCHVLELADVRLVALESDAERAVRIGENLQRLGLEADVRIGDAGAPETWHDGTAFDRILADVPCSASGIVRRHPDIRWLRRPADIAALAREQQRIVDALWPLVAPGGELLYVTCSIFPEEGEEQAARFERVHQDAVRLDAPGQLAPVSASAANALAASETAGMRAAERTGSDIDHDGFFYARFQKR